jgi:hypothetical protein
MNRIMVESVTNMDRIFTLLRFRSNIRKCHDL